MIVPEGLSEMRKIKWLSRLKNFMHMSPKLAQRKSADRN